MNVAALFAQSAAAHGERVAVVSNGQAYTYRQCWERALRMAGWLVEVGLGSGDRVATLEHNTISAVDLFVATALVGVVRVGLTPGVSDESVQHVIAATGCRAVIHDATIAVPASVRTGLAEPGLILSRTDSYEAELCRHAPLALEHRTLADISPDAAFVVRTTGGTTGHPKAIVYSHRAWLAACRDWFYPLPMVELGDRSLNISPLSHGGAFFFTTIWLAGGTNVLAGRTELARLGEVMRSEQIAYAFMVPPMLELLLAQSDEPLPALKAIAIAGGTTAEPVVRRALATFGPRIWQVYGLTEAVPIACMTPESAADAMAAGQPHRHAVGRIMPFAQARIVVADEDLGTTIGGLPVGEVAVRCDSSLARAAFVADPRTPASAAPDPEGWVTTGDAGAIGPDGYLYLAGRLQDAVRTMFGVVWPASVEHAVLNVAGVRSAAVVARTRADSGLQTPVAVCVPEPGAELSLDALETACATATQGRWSHIEGVIVVQSDQLALTPAGKVDRRRIAAELPPVVAPAVIAPPETFA
jgi:acyl-CoA synthetase (AMP-forming)/AMP-acid ligase II